MKRTFTFLLLAFLFTAGSDKTWGQTNVPALIQTNQIWDISGSPYLINQNTFIDSGVSVKIMPGVEVLAQTIALTLQVDGELQALGTHDSTILFDHLQIQLNPDALAYDSATGSGALFKYCTFTESGVGKRAINANRTGLRVENCLFTDIYYPIFVMAFSGSHKIEVINCTFNDNTGTSFPIYFSGIRTIDAVLIGNTFNNFNQMGGFILSANTLYMVDNTLNGQKRVSLTAIASTISCNLFKNLRMGVEVSIHYQVDPSSCTFTHNTIDSCGSTFSGDFMLTVKGQSSSTLNNSRFNNNNFLTNSGTNEKVSIEGYNPDLATSESVNMKNNHWGSIDSAVIETYIKDYSDDINIYGRADFSGFLSAEDTTCGEDTFTSSCTASYYLAVDTADMFNLYIIHNSTGTTSNTSYSWDFGDGTGSNAQNPTHSYAEFGKYRLCLTLYDSLENCNSTYCDSIGLDSTGTLLKSNAFKIMVLNESDINGINERNVLNDIKVYPNPSNGTLNIEIQEQGKIDLTLMDLAGRHVYETRLDAFATQTNTVDLSSLQNGMYLLHLQKGNDKFTTKIMISK